MSDKTNDQEYQAMIRRIVDQAPPLDEARAKRIAALVSGSSRDTLNRARPVQSTDQTGS